VSQEAVTQGRFSNFVLLVSIIGIRFTLEILSEFDVEFLGIESGT